MLTLHSPDENMKTIHIRISLRRSKRIAIRESKQSANIEMKKVYMYYAYKYLLASGACLWSAQVSTRFG